MRAEEFDAHFYGGEFNQEQEVTATELEATLTHYEMPMSHEAKKLLSYGNACARLADFQNPIQIVFYVIARAVAASGF